MVTLDIESCGLVGMPIILQWAEDDGPVNLHRIWQESIRDTLELIQWIMTQDVQGFNLAFDHFMLCKVYTTFSMYENWDHFPENHISELAILEERARFLDICLKPKRARDIMLLARRGPYQNLMPRDPIRIRRVPVALAEPLRQELENRVHLDDIYFAKAKRGEPRWKIRDTKNKDKDFRDLDMCFKASGALKTLAKHALGIKNVTLFQQVEVDRRYWPDELHYAPWALAVTPAGPDEFWTGTGKDGNVVKSWPSVINEHILTWGYNQAAREYAAKDVEYTRELGKIISPEVEPGDVDSELACLVAAVRWRGYALDLPELRRQRQIAHHKIRTDIPTAPHKVTEYLREVMDPRESVALKSTKKGVLEYMVRAEEWKDHPAQQRASLVLESRKAKKRRELIDKLLRAGRLHPDFKVIGALSSRMSGAGGVNTQGIDHTTEMRRCFLLADPYAYKIVDGELKETSESSEHVLCGGDFKAFEVSLAAKVFADPALDAALMSGKKIHAMLGMEIFPGKSYEEVCASEGTSDDMYDKGKKGVFLMFYGGDANTFKNKLGIDLEIAERADSRFKQRFPGIAHFGREVFNRFGSLIQVGAIGSAIKWREPQEFAETFLGFRRYFTLENGITKALFELAQKPPPAWRTLRISVRRRDRVQTASGAVQSALYGAAFQINAGVLRAAKNHYIQSPGAEITKAVQKVIWDHQPSGIGPWIVEPLNAHDEVMCVTRRGHESRVEESVNVKVAEYRKTVPLLAIDWFNGIPNWGQKKARPADFTISKGPPASKEQHGTQRASDSRINVHDLHVPALGAH